MWLTTAIILAAFAIHSAHIQRLHRDATERHKTVVESIVLLTKLHSTQRVSIENLDHDVHHTAGAGGNHRAVP
jgi:hypothetical protein